MVHGVIALAHDPETQYQYPNPAEGDSHLHMQMRLPILLRISDPLLQNLLCFLYKLSVQINRIVRHSPLRIILPKDIIRGLLVILIHLRRMLLSLLRQLMRRSPISALVCLMRLSSRSASVYSTRE